MTDTMQYGPQTAEVEALLARVRTLTGAEALALDETWYAAWDATRDATRDAAWYAAQDAAQDAAWGAALDAVWDAVWGAARVAARGAVRDAVRDAERYAARYVAWDAALALVARDLITPDGFTQEHYDLLTGPWRRVVGRVHPEDDEVK